MVEAIQCNSYDLVEPVPKIIANMKNLRWIYWRGDLASPFPSNFLPSELCCLTLDGISPKQLWKGYKVIFLVEKYQNFRNKYDV